MKNCRVLGWLNEMGVLGWFNGVESYVGYPEHAHCLAHAFYFKARGVKENPILYMV